MQLQPPNIVNRFPISVMEPNEQLAKTEKQQKKINNSEMLGPARTRLKEELRQLKLEAQNNNELLLGTKSLLVNAGKQREFCRRKIEMLNTELEVGKSEAEANKGMCRSSG